MARLYLLPMRDNFDEHVRAALDSLPPNIASALRNVAVVVEDENPEDPDVYGLYHGVPLPERGDGVGLLPDKISIYRIPLEESFPDPEELREEIRITVLHELAHYFGLEEDRIAELGYE
jgi:predicted Zn-dependent protease with MMP-like domain